MKKPKYIWVSGIAVFLFATCFFLVFGLPPYKPPKRNCPLNSTIVSPQSFPIGTLAEPLVKIDQPSRDSIGRTFNLEGGVTINDTLRFSNSRLAREKFDSAQRVLINKGWQVPPEINFVSQIADDFFYACGQTYFGTRCEANGLYEEYYILLSAHMHEDGVTNELFEELLVEIDKRMMQCLEVSVTEDVP